MRSLSLVAFAAVAAGPVLAQSNTLPGVDGRLTNNAGPTYYGRRGPAHPDGEIGMSYSYTMCNPGSVPIQWTAPMNPSHPMFAFSVVRESNGRMEQITNNATTYVKHAFAAANSSSTCGGTCQSSGSGLRVFCTDTYGAGTNANRYYLGPAEEIDPWTGIWNPVGSYFDRGDPDVGPPANSDGVRSLTSGTTGVFTDLVKNRVTLREADLLVPGRLFHCMHIVVRGEDGDLHLDNLGHRQVLATWNGSTWGFSNPGSFIQGTVLDQWAGAAVTRGRNGDDDGHFIVAVKVTPLPGGSHHYEYVVQNFDNARGGATLRVPLCGSSMLANVGFRDVDGNTLNDWTWTRTGEDLVFSAPAGNSLDWNTMFNFWFDTDAAPGPGEVAIDQARLGAGGLTVAVASQVPGGTAAALGLGPGCGGPSPVLRANGLPTIPNAGFALTLGTVPGAGLLLFYSLATTAMPVAPGCTQYVDPAFLGTWGFLLADGVGQATAPVPIPSAPSLEALQVSWQAAQFAAGGPVGGAFALSNGVLTRLGCR